jgi:transposase
MRRARFRR